MRLLNQLKNLNLYSKIQPCDVEENEKVGENNF